MPAATSVTWRGLTISGPSTPGAYQFRDIVGWEELPPFNTQKLPVGGAHGTIVSPLQFDERSVTVTGWCYDPVNRDALLLAFRSSMAPLPETTVTESLTISHGGRDLSADARIVAVQALPEAGWAMGRFGWMVQWLCNDPLRYGAYQTASVVYPQPGPGLALPLALPQAMPDSIPGGVLSVVNDGTALAPAIYTIRGPVTNPGVMVNPGTQWQQQVSYRLELAEGSTLVVDTAQGAGLLNGEYVPPSGTSGLTADLVLRPGANVVQAMGLSGVSDPLPSITVLFRPAYW